MSIGEETADAVRRDAGPDIRSGRLAPARLAENFGDAHPPLSAQQAVIEASRCYFCYDAPCVEACPTGIDIPSFIRSIQTGNTTGAATTILNANIMGGMCARVCPVEELCEEACVRNLAEDKPVGIGALQRFATDHLFDEGRQPFTRAAPTGRRIAVAGAGPAGLACAHRLAVLGHDVTVFEAREKGGGLNEFGIAAYKTVDDFAQRELAFILSVGGITLKTGVALGRDIALADLRRDYDAVFLGLGHNAVNALGADGEDFDGVVDAVDYIEALRQAPDKGTLPVGRKVVVIGGGNTGIDIATQIKRLGAEDVTLVYRRGPESMSATWKEQEWAQTNDVRIKHWARPVRLIGWPGGNGRRAVKEIEFEYTQLDDRGRLAGTGDTFTLLADQVFKAIGQTFQASTAFGGEGAEILDRAGDRIAVNEDRMTSLAGVFAGGDCVPGTDLTVAAVEDGKIAANAIDRLLRN
ncbi:NAD(P)-dependent oxidoreductase [Fodinicurvata sp. EGI_FJ10296]|uniref:NAD(P)-dependent oxidoreductase n=1 Tax=Fodinicurvata sp. EGI_FJ10296 TaxID=3231908 RepID=UPI0034568501